MPDIASALRAEIRSEAGKEMARALKPLASIAKDLRSLVVLLRQQARAPRVGAMPRERRASAAAAKTAGAALKPAEIRGMRARMGLTRPRFAKQVGVSTWTVFMWEHGKVAPKPASVARLRRLEKTAAKAPVAKAGPLPKALAGGSASGLKGGDIRKLRARLGMKRPQFAKQLGVSTWTVFMWEHGKVVPGPANVARLQRLAKTGPAGAQPKAKPRRKR